MLKGKMAFKEANTLYGAQNYTRRQQKYQEALAQGLLGTASASPPEIAYSYFFLANSYDQMFRPVKKGDPKNDANLTKAIEYYEKAAEVSRIPNTGNGPCSTWRRVRRREAQRPVSRPSRSSSG